ncbi:MAG TPA: flotillin family protein, partial [Erythrobacter sp.]
MSLTTTTTAGELATTGAADSTTALITYAVGVGAVLFVIVFLAFLIRLYRRASKETAFVRTGMGGEKVVMNGGALVLPVLHEAMPVNMNTLVLSVVRRDTEALITLDRLRIDVKAEFYVRVRPDAAAIAMAAQTLGQRTMQPDLLKDLVEGK